jgi:hypothetical protein
MMLISKAAWFGAEQPKYPLHGLYEELDMGMNRTWVPTCSLIIDMHISWKQSLELNSTATSSSELYG